MLYILNIYSIYIIYIYINELKNKSDLPHLSILLRCCLRSVQIKAGNCVLVRVLVSYRPFRCLGTFIVTLARKEMDQSFR